MCRVLSGIGISVRQHSAAATPILRWLNAPGGFYNQLNRTSYEDIEFSRQGNLCRNHYCFCDDYLWRAERGSDSLISYNDKGSGFLCLIGGGKGYFALMPKEERDRIMNEEV